MVKNKLIPVLLGGVVLLGAGAFFLVANPLNASSTSEAVVVNPAMAKPGQPFRFAPHNPEIVALGKTVYLDQCAACHGVNLEGQVGWQDQRVDGMRLAPPHDETGHTWHHADELLFLLTKNGINSMLSKPYPNNMPVYQDILTDEEIFVALSYIKSQWAPEVQRIHDDINANYDLNKH